ncbi:PAS domain-containing protein [Sphingobacterium sp. BS-2]|uniref:PAS domain-containing protein n=1 Tax=Sphingobacterium sp. BS-2 TaxID=3377129 RepID=UPI0038FC4A3A
MEHDDLFELSPIPMWVHDRADLSLLAVNKVARGLYGFTDKQFTQMTAADLFADPNMGIREGCIANGTPQRHRNSQGDTFLLRLFSAPVTYSGRDACLVTAVEIHQERSLDHVSLLDGAGNFIRASPSHGKLIGLQPQELSGMSILGFVTPPARERIAVLLDRAMRGETVPSGSFPITCRNGERRWLSSDLSGITLYGKGMAVRVGLWDVTEHKVRELREASLDRMERESADASSLEEVVDCAIRAILDLEEIITAEVWLVSRDPSSLGLSGRASQRDGQYLLKGFSPGFSCGRGEGLPGKVWEEMDAVITENEGKDQGPAVGIPIVSGKNFLGCIICFPAGSPDGPEGIASFLKRASSRIAGPIAHKMKEIEYLTLFDISPDPHCIIGRDGKIERYNRAFAALANADGAIDQAGTILEMLHPEDVAQAKRDFISMVNGWSSGPFRTRISAAPGNLRTLLWSAAISRESMRIVAVGKDITDQANAEKELYGALQRLRNAQKIAKLGYWFRPLSSQVSVWSEETYSIYERSPRNFLPTMENLRSAFFPGDRYLLDTDPALLLPPNSARGFEHRIVTPLGRVKWVRQEVQLIMGDDGTPLRMEGTIQDITERKGYEERLFMSNEIFRLAMKASNEMIWHADLVKNTYTRGGRDGQQPISAGTSEEFSKSNSWFSTICTGDRERVWDSLGRVIADPAQDAWYAEYRAVSADGHIHHYQDRCHVLRDTAGNAVQLVGAVLDVTTPRMHLEKIEEQNRALREIAWTQSHLFRAPLTRLMGLAEVSLRHGGGGLSPSRIMELILDSAEELDLVIRTLTEKANSIEDGKFDDTLGG